MRLGLGSYKKKVQNAKRNRRGGVSPPVAHPACPDSSGIYRGSRVGGPNPYKDSIAVARFLNMSLGL